MESHREPYRYYDVIIESCVGHSTAAYWEAGGGGALAASEQCQPAGQAGRPPHTRVGSSYVLYGKGSCLFGSRMHLPACSARERRRAKSMNERSRGNIIAINPSKAREAAPRGEDTWSRRRE
eukprot:scaffold103252_cov56-Attheya_sp.AAC.4